MTWQSWLMVIGIATFLLWHRLRHLRRYPTKACPRCHGAGRLTSTNLFGAVVSGACPRCNGSPWTPRIGGG
ncbi:MAG: hypothetical protein ACRDRM_06430 [Pseudonocardiaceae bacterium]